MIQVGGSPLERGVDVRGADDATRHEGHGDAVVLVAVLGHELLEREDLVQDPRFKENWDRVKHRRELLAILEPIFLQRTRQAWMDAFAEHEGGFAAAAARLRRKTLPRAGAPRRRCRRRDPRPAVARAQAGGPPDQAAPGPYTTSPRSELYNYKLCSREILL